MAIRFTVIRAYKFTSFQETTRNHQIQMHVHCMRALTWTICSQNCIHIINSSQLIPWRRLDIVMCREWTRKKRILLDTPSIPQMPLSFFAIPQNDPGQPWMSNYMCYFSKIIWWIWPFVLCYMCCLSNYMSIDPVFSFRG